MFALCHRFKADLEKACNLRMISKEHADILKTIFAMFLSQLNFLSQNDQKALSVPVTDVWFHLHLTISSLLHISKLIGPLFCFGFFFFWPAFDAEISLRPSPTV